MTENEIKVLDDRHVLCPVCRQVRGCSHLAAEIEGLRARVAQVLSDGEQNAAAIQASLKRAEGIIQDLREKLGQSEKDRATSEASEKALRDGLGLIATMAAPGALQRSHDLGVVARDCGAIARTTLEGGTPSCSPELEEAMLPLPEARLSELEQLLAPFGETWSVDRVRWMTATRDLLREVRAHRRALKIYW